MCIKYYITFSVKIKPESEKIGNFLLKSTSFPFFGRFETSAEHALEQAPAIPEVAWETHCIDAPEVAWETHCIDAPEVAWKTQCIDAPEVAWEMHCIDAPEVAWEMHCIDAPEVAAAGKRLVRSDRI